MKKYSLGLDIGTNSVGWAVVDENNNVVKKNGKTLFGVRLFDKAKSAKETRVYRGSRIRTNRRKERMERLKNLFAKEINKVDNTFFERLGDSTFVKEDKRNGNHYNLFEGDYTDKDFFNEYKTIYHLRQHLLNTNEKADIRFIYLAIAHMTKYRGNFLLKGDLSLSDSSVIVEMLDNFETLQLSQKIVFEDYDEYFEPFNYSKENVKKIEEILLSSNMGKKDKKDAIITACNINKKTFTAKFLIPLLVGSAVSLNNLDVIKYLKLDSCSISINEENLENAVEEKVSLLPKIADIIRFIVEIKQVADFYFIKKILKTSKSNQLSEAMVNLHNNHNEQLVELKQFIKRYLPSKYNECFRKTKVAKKEALNNYPRYVGRNSCGKGVERFAHCTREEFYKYIKELFGLIKDEEAKEYIDRILLEMENNEFLQRQNSDQNGVIPMQLNLMELEKILKVQNQFYPFLEEKDETGYSVSEKIILNFQYKIPYYVGHLNPNSKTSWVVREKGPITPWNFEQKVNLEETAKAFITHMQRKCSYLKGPEDYCIPKNSLAFSEYDCLSYINKLSVDGITLSGSIKEDLFKEVFLKIKNPSRKDIFDYLAANQGIIDVKTTRQKDLPEIKCNMASYIKFKEIFKDSFENSKEMIEDIIRDIVLFEDKTILEKRLKETYKLDLDTIRKIKDLNYKGYANLSRNLLTGLSIINNETGEKYNSLLAVMRDTNYNLQEILYDEKYRFIDIINEYNKKYADLMPEMDLEDYMEEYIYVSPIMKRALIQAYKIVDEVEKIIGEPIYRYYIECGRIKSKNKVVPESRYSSLDRLYKENREAIDKIADYDKLYKQLQNNKDKLRREALYLYFTQLGKCMYSLENIDLDDLLQNNLIYDSDHIYPQAIIKDDSLNNKVLSKKIKNSAKGDNFLFELDGFLPEKATQFYKLLLDRKLITKDKYERLTKKELNPGELEGFTNRQIVATNQSVKSFIEVLKQFKKVDNTNIIYSKAANITSFRKTFDLPKSRLANNFHHAHDAYLNAVVGRAIDCYYKANYMKSFKDYQRMKAEGITINPDKILTKNRYANNKLIWDVNKDIKTIKKNLFNRYDVFETIRTFNGNELFKKVSLLPVDKSGDKNKIMVPIKSNGILSDTSKYGSITSYAYSKYIIIKVTVKADTKYILEAIPKAYDNRVSEYLTQCGYSNYVICHDNIKTNVIIKLGELKYCITGKSGDMFSICNLQDQYFNYSAMKTIKKVEKCLENEKEGRKMVQDDDSIILYQNNGKKLNESVLTREELLSLVENLGKKYSLNKYCYGIIKKLYNALLNDKGEAIKNMEIKTLVTLVSNLITILKPNCKTRSDLTAIGLSKNSGVLTINKVLLPGMKFISESVTGYYEKVLFEVSKSGL